MNDESGEQRDSDNYKRANLTKRDNQGGAGYNSAERGHTNNLNSAESQPNRSETTPSNSPNNNNQPQRKSIINNPDDASIYTDDRTLVATPGTIDGPNYNPEYTGRLSPTSRRNSADRHFADILNDFEEINSRKRSRNEFYLFLIVFIFMSGFLLTIAANSQHIRGFYNRYKDDKEQST